MFSGRTARLCCEQQGASVSAPWREPHQSKYLSQGEVFTLVSHVDITWNSFLPYLVTFADRLEDLGFRYVDGEVFVPKEEMSEK